MSLTPGARLAPRPTQGDLEPGRKVGPYEIVSLLGEGGMGQVYRALDTKLNRDVAIKVLPEEFASDGDRLARFTREAQTLAALNHPNIAAIYGIEESVISDGAPGLQTRGTPTRALVMELVEGKDLAVLIVGAPGRSDGAPGLQTRGTPGPEGPGLRGGSGRRGIPLDEALAIARQIADALEAAHEQGIIHRDLKPANVMVRPDGMVKVLDFGLAKAMDSGPGTQDPSNSPTLTARSTQVGMVIGTAAYMAPEQARGKAVDRRADIWAFGVVLYEMLTGRRAFEGEDISITLASVLKEDVDWQALPDGLPIAVRRLLRRCLEKDPRQRLSAIGDARLELDERDPIVGLSGADPVLEKPTLWSRLWPAAVAVVLTAGIAAAWGAFATTDVRGPVTRLAILPPPGADVYPDSDQVSISPDGTMVVYVVGTPTQAKSQLWVRSLDSASARRLEEGDNAFLPFWSPDSRRIGFFTSDKLITIASAGGRADVLSDAPDARGGAWNASNDIVFAPDSNGPLYRIAASGGAPVPVTSLDADKKESSHRYPVFLPDGDHFLFAALPARAGKFDIYVGSISQPSRTFVGSLESAPVYADPGWLLYARRGVLVAQPFDADVMTLTGDPVPLDDEPVSIMDPALSWTGSTAASVSRTGSLVYFSSASTRTLAKWYDANGLEVGTLELPPGHYDSATISPDGTRAVLVRSESPSESSQWLADLERGGASSFAAGPGRNDAPVWSPDGRQVVFAADRDGPQNIYVKMVDDRSPERLLHASDILFKWPTHWSADGKWIILAQLDRDTAHNLWRLPASGEGDLAALVRGPQLDRDGAVSPDGRWLAYASDETGRFEVYVQSFPEPGRRVQASRQGALTKSWWTEDSRQLMFLDLENRLWRVDLESGAGPQLGAPKQIAVFPSSVISIDAMPDRRRFLGIEPESTGVGSITVVQNWRVALDKAR